MKAKQPWRPHYTRDWANDPFVRGLDPEARCVYSELLDIAWEEGGLRLEWVTTGVYVAHRIGVSRRKFLAIWDRIRFKFEESSPETLSNNRLEDIRSAARKLSEKQSNIAKQRYLTSASDLPGGSARSLPSESESESESKRTEPLLLSAQSSAFDFEQIYRAYPGKSGKAKGLEALRKTVKSRDQYDAILRAATAYSDEERRFKASGSKEFHPAVPYFSTWVNQRRWEDQETDTKPEQPAFPDGMTPHESPATARHLHKEAVERGFKNHAERLAAEGRA